MGTPYAGMPCVMLSPTPELHSVGFDGSKLIEPSESSPGQDKVGSPEAETSEPALSLDPSLEHLENDCEFVKAQEEANAAWRPRKP